MKASQRVRTKRYSGHAAGAHSIKIQNDRTFSLFISHGYLPEVLPPIFSSEPFAKSCLTNTPEIPLSSSFDRISYNCTKRNHSRRIFDVIHPVSAVTSAAWLAKHWEAVQEFCNSPQSTATKLALSEDLRRRAITAASFDDVQRAAKSRTARARYVVRADIAKFYPSIYTHSIPWALNGKELAKVKTDRFDEEVFGNELDWALRIGQSGQTKGVPIGSDISRVSAEIIGSAIDKAVQERCGTRIVGYIRNIDDFQIGCRSLSDAEYILTALSNSLRAYELTLNDEKTNIIEAREQYDDDWARAIAESW